MTGGFVDSTAYYALLQIFILLAFAELLRSVAERHGFPPTVGEVLAGMVLGTYAVGGLINHYVVHTQFFVVNDFVLLFADFSVILLIFAAGLEGGFSSLRSVGAPAVGAAILGDVIPFAAAFVVFSLFFPIHTALLIGAAAGATSTAVIASLIRSEGLATHQVGRFLLNTAALDDVVALLLLTVALTANPTNLNVISLSGGLALTVVAWLVILFASVYFIPRILRPFSTRSSTTAPFVILFALVAIVASLGFSAIIGAYVAGLAVGESLLASRTKRLADLLLVIFGSLFFVVVGAEFDVRILLDPAAWLFAAFLTGIAIFGKMAGVYLLARTRFAGSELRTVVVGMIPRAEIGLIVAAIGYTLGVFDQDLLGAILLMSIVTTLVGGYLFKTEARHLTVGEARRPLELEAGAHP